MFSPGGDYRVTTSITLAVAGKQSEINPGERLAMQA